MADTRRRMLLSIYDRLYEAYGPQGWWPGDSDIETVVGAILTQNTAWKNVERAIFNLKSADCLSWNALRDLPQRSLEALIRPAGTYRVKAARLRAFVKVLWDDYGGSLDKLLTDGRLETARKRLLEIHGIGPETADAVLLYAGRRPTFVVDRYALRIMRRHFVIGCNESYESARALLQSLLPRRHRLFNEYHALLVALGKRHCRQRARCDGCPLADLPHDPQL